MKLRFASVVLGAALALGLAGQALAFDCFNPNKPVGAGSVGTVNGAFTPNKNNPGTEDQPHGGFVTLDLGAAKVDISAHQHLPPVREGGPQANCDGKGLDSLEACFGG